MRAIPLPRVRLILAVKPDRLISNPVSSTREKQPNPRPGALPISAVKKRTESLSLILLRGICLILWKMRHGNRDSLLGILLVIVMHAYTHGDRLIVF